jgi:phosphoglycerate dehydrogenase-like enzyme
MARRLARSVKPMVQRTSFEPLLKQIWRAGKSKLNLTGDDRLEALRDLSGVTVGLIGWSANARAFVELLRPFKVTVKVFTEHASDAELQRANVQKTVLTEVLAADIVSLIVV